MRSRFSLTLTTGEFVRISTHVIGRHPDPLEQTRNALALGLAPGQPMDVERFADRLANSHTRI